MIQPFNCVDEYYISPERTVLTGQQLHIPGVRMLAWHTARHALSPLPWHYHRNAFEFSLLMEGSLAFSTRERTYPFSGGEVLVSWPDEVHSSEGSPLNFGELYWFQLDISSPEKFLFLEEEAARKLMGQLYGLPHHVIRLKDKETGQLLKNAFSLAATGSDPAATASCGLSVSRYKKKFRDQMGISPRNYINREKIQASRKLLRSGLSVAETAMRMGFDSSSYFANVFRRYVALSPTEYVISCKNRDRDTPSAG